MKILVVDDSDYARKRIGKILRDGGHEVIEADGGEAALRLDEETIAINRSWKLIDSLPK
jgi:CheY-like chemotaxis protein